MRPPPVAGQARRADGAAGCQRRRRDTELDAALASIGESTSPAEPGEWVGRPWRRILGGYLEWLMATGVICERFTWEGLFALQRIAHWRICDAERLAEARQRLDLIASSVGMADLGQTAYASLTCAVGLDRLLYRGRSRRAERDRLREIVAGRWTTSPAAPDAATFAAIRAAADAVTHAAQAARAAAVASVGRYSTG